MPFLGNKMVYCQKVTDIFQKPTIHAVVEKQAWVIIPHNEAVRKRVHIDTDIFLGKDISNVQGAWYGNARHVLVKILTRYATGEEVYEEITIDWANNGKGMTFHVIGHMPLRTSDGFIKVENL